jgi:hypothetical protein
MYFIWKVTLLLKRVESETKFKKSQRIQWRVCYKASIFKSNAFPVWIPDIQGKIHPQGVPSRMRTGLFIHLLAKKPLKHKVSGLHSNNLVV